MPLELRSSEVKRLELGAAMALDAGTLTVDALALSEAARRAHEAVDEVDVHIATPGDATRILCVKDVIEPRHKLSGTRPGTGVTRVLEKLAVVTCGPIVGFQEGIIDMSGPAAAYTPFSEIALIVLEIRPRAHTSAHEHEAAVRAAGLAAAEHLAARFARTEPDATRVLNWDPASAASSLPRIAYVDMLLSQGLLHDSYVLGRNAADMLPCTIDPLAVLDTGIVSGNCVSACDKTTTYHHQHNPIIGGLLAAHGRSLAFAGVVLTHEPTRLSEKRSAAARAVELVKELGADGAVISKEGFGNPDADLMMIVSGLESAGIRTVAITDEYAGPDGGSQSLADSAPEADALVSVGNANERHQLPPMQRVIGPAPDVARIAGGYAQSYKPDGSIDIELQAIVGSTNQLGFSKLSCREI